MYQIICSKEEKERLLNVLNSDEADCLFESVEPCPRYGQTINDVYLAPDDRNPEGTIVRCRTCIEHRFNWILTDENE